MTIPYRTRRTLRRVGMGLLVIMILSLVIWLCWMFWLGRFVVYTRDKGAYFDFNQSSLDIVGQEAVAPPEAEKVPVYYNEGEGALNASKELTKITGYYITEEELINDIAGVKEKLANLERGTAVMLDVKNIQGCFLYDSAVSTVRAKQVDVEAMMDLISFLRLRELYAIARVPAFRDYYYGLNHLPDGLAAAGGYLWMVDARCYWLNPSSSGTLSYLASIVTELQDLGFNEVVFYDFRFPDTSSIVFNGDRAESLAQAADFLVSTCATEYFTVSFDSVSGFTLPEGRCRFLIRGVAAAEAANVAQSMGLDKPAERLVFLTDLHDTRFDEYSVLRPISSAH